MDDPDITESPIDQAPPFWDASIEWKIEKNKSTQNAYRKILNSLDYQKRSRELNQLFTKKLSAVKATRAAKQRAYAHKALKRRPLSVQSSRNLNKCTLSLVTLRATDCSAKFRAMLVKWKFEPYNPSIEGAEPKQESDGTRVLHFQSSMENMTEFILSQNILEFDELRLKTCSYAIMGINVLDRIPVPRRGSGLGSKANPTDIDQITGCVHSGLVLLRTLDGCDYKNSIDSKCTLCRQRHLILRTTRSGAHQEGENSQLSPLRAIKKIKLWTARDKRGDRQKASKIRAKEILEANKNVPCPRGCASNLSLAPITKNTRSIHWSRVFNINKEKYTKFKMQESKKKKRQKDQEKRYDLKHSQTRKTASGSSGNRPQTSNGGDRRQRSRQRVRPITVGDSKTDTVLHLLGDHNSLTKFRWESPTISKIVGTKNSHVHSNAARNVLRQRIQLTTGAILKQKSQWRRQGFVELFSTDIGDHGRTINK